MIRAFLVLAAALALPALAQSMYKWVDEKGVTHYSERPPEKGEAKKLDIRVEPASRPAPDDWKARDLESKRGKIQQDEKARAEEAQKDAQRMARCRSALARLDQLRNTQRLYRLNAKGEREYVEDEQRPALLEAAEREVKENCPS